MTLLIVWHYKRVKELPPGPFSLPIIGSVCLWQNGSPFKSGELFDKKFFHYKDWYTLFTGTEVLVILNDYQFSKDIFARDEFSGRETSWWQGNIRGFHGKNVGIIATEGQTWTTQRRFALKVLRDLGFGKKKLDSIMVEEVDEIIENMLKEGIVKMDSTFNNGIINVLWQIVASKRFDPKMPETKALLNRINRIMSDGFTYKMFLPEFLAKNLPLDYYDRGVLELNNTTHELIKEHMVDLDPDHPRDFIDVYLKQISQDPVNFDIEQLIGLCGDFLFAGSETTS